MLDVADFTFDVGDILQTRNVKVDVRVITFFHCVLNTFFWLYRSVRFEGNSTYAN